MKRIMFVALLVLASCGSHAIAPAPQQSPTPIDIDASDGWDAGMGGSSVPLLAP